MIFGKRYSHYIPRYNTNRLQRITKYQEVKIQNSISIKIQNLPFSTLKKLQNSFNANV